jgi:glycosyltransferase involved in cell wall biosynthesis
MLEELCSEEAISLDASPRSQLASRASGKSIIFVNKYFYPDHSATSQILSDLAFHLAASGYSVRVFTSQQRYDDPRAQLPEVETTSGVSINRLATTRFGRSTLLGRGLDYLSFYRSAWRCVLDRANPGDILVAKTDPPLLCVAAMRAANRRGLHLINWLQDLYPEVAIQLDVPFVKGPVAQALMYYRDLALCAAAANVVVGERMADILRARGVGPDRIHIIPNWCDDDEIQPVPRHDNPLRREWSLEGRFVVGYSGNLGKAHEFDSVLAAAEYLRADPRIVFLFIGGGSKFDALAQNVTERKLTHLFRFEPYQERTALKHSLGVPDVHWFSLKPELEGLVVPSKFYGIAAAARPMIAVTAQHGELAQLIRLYGCGEVVEPGNGEHLAATLRRLSADGQGLAEMGLRARTMLEAQFTRREAFESWKRLFQALDGAEQKRRLV